MKWIAGYEGRYKVDAKGNVYSFIANGHKGKAMKMKAPIAHNGYERVVLQKDGKVKQCMVHRLVSMAYIPNSNSKPQVNHINGIKTDNRVQNLEWVTARENNLHAWDNSLYRTRTSRKFTDSEVRTIRQLFDNGLSMNKIAKKYGVYHSRIRTIVRKITHLGKAL